jgi:hypothetical protein
MLTAGIVVEAENLDPTCRRLKCPTKPKKQHCAHAVELPANQLVTEIPGLECRAAFVNHQLEEESALVASLERNRNHRRTRLTKKKKYHCGPVVESHANQPVTEIRGLVEAVVVASLEMKNYRQEIHRI